MKCALALVATLSLLLATSCIRLPKQEENAFSLLISAEDLKPNGTSWDYAPDIVLPLPVPTAGLEFSRYPDLVAYVVNEEGQVFEYNGGKDSSGKAQSRCPDRLLCRYLIDQIPSGYFMVVVVDLDLDEPDFVGALVFSENAKDEFDDVRVKQLEDKARELFGAKVDDYPTDSLPVVARNACRSEVCEANPEISSVAMAVTALHVSPDPVQQAGN